MRGLVKKSTSGDARRQMISVGETPGIRGRPQERAPGLLILEAPGRILCGPGGIFWNPYVRDLMDSIPYGWNPAEGFHWPWRDLYGAEA